METPWKGPHPGIFIRHIQALRTDRLAATRRGGWVEDRGHDNTWSHG